MWVLSFPQEIQQSRRTRRRRNGILKILYCTVTNGVKFLLEIFTGNLISLSQASRKVPTEHETVNHFPLRA